MHAATLLCLVFTVTATARPGLLHDKAHHTHEVLENIHQTPHCAYVCIFDETYQARFAPECGNLEGLTLGSCLCRADAYQYIVDQCVERKCSPNDRKKVSHHTIDS